MAFLLRVEMRGKNLFLSTEVNFPGMPGKVFIGMEVGVWGAGREDKLWEPLKKG